MWVIGVDVTEPRVEGADPAGFLLVLCSLKVSFHWPGKIIETYGSVS